MSGCRSRFWPVAADVPDLPEKAPGQLTLELTLQFHARGTSRSGSIAARVPSGAGAATAPPPGDDQVAVLVLRAENVRRAVDGAITAAAEQEVALRAIVEEPDAAANRGVAVAASASTRS